ncbi:MAG: FlgD immunoglobulin-like domain containing protein, partial [Calditrichia bacterium]
YDFVMNIPAVQSPAYNVVVSTFADSSSAGTNYFTFLVTAHTIDPNIFFISRRDSGYSVDNIPPAPPANLTAQNITGPVELNWDANSEPDLRQYLLYRSTLPNIDPDQIAPFATTNTNNFIDNNPLPGGTSYYIVQAEDIHDNRSLPSNEVEVRTLIQFQKTVITDWNIVGLPSEVLDTYYLSLFPTAIPRTLFGYDGKYFELDTLDLSQGYWLRFSSPDSFILEGFPVQSTSINLMEGWNLLSGPSCDVALTDVIDPQGIILQGTLFGFEITYIAADTMKQGTGYWLRANAAGQIILNCGNSQSFALAKGVSTVNRYTFSTESSTFPSITLQDAAGAEQTLYFNVRLNSPQEKLHYSLPPVPPPGKNIFDARFTGDYWVSETFDDEIKLRATNFPLILTPLNFDDNGEEQFTLTEFISGIESVNQPIKNGTQIKISDPRVTSLRLHKTKVTPLNFEVSQNFPNPFNPVTEIRYTIPEAGKVKVVVYNSLGQKIKTLLSETQEARHHKLRWDGRNDSGQQVGSGVYYLSVKSGKYSATRKMILMR